MQRKPHSTGSIVGAVGLLVVVLLGLYVGGYFALGKCEVDHWKSGTIVLRTYPFHWLACVYIPMMCVEAAVTGNVVALDGPVPVDDSQR